MSVCVCVCYFKPVVCGNLLQKQQETNTQDILALLLKATGPAKSSPGTRRGSKESAHWRWNSIPFLVLCVPFIVITHWHWNWSSFRSKGVNREVIPQMSQLWGNSNQDLLLRINSEKGMEAPATLAALTRATVSSGPLASVPSIDISSDSCCFYPLSLDF